MAGEAEAERRVRLASEPPFRLGELLVIPAERRILIDGASETLEPRIMQVLTALARADGAIVSRDQLIASCWDGRVVGDNAIHRAMSKIREISLRAGDGGFRVETIAKVGYRIVATGCAGKASADAPAPASDARADVSRRMLSRRGLMAGGAVAVTAGAAGLWLWLRSSVGGDPRVADLIAQAEQAGRAGVPDSDAQGAGFLEEATMLDPDSALAWGRLALARAVMAEYAPAESVAELVAATQDAARRALSISPHQVDALAALALLPPYYGDWAAAEARMRNVLSVDPEHLPTRDALSFLLVGAGRMGEGARDRLILAAREPLHAVQQFRLIYALWMLGRIAEADRAAERALQLWPQHPGAWFGRLWTLAFTGRAERGLAHIDRSTAPDGLGEPMQDALRLSMQALSTGAGADVARAGDALLAMVSQSPSVSINAVMLLSGMGDLDRAFAVADAYLLERGPLLSSLRWSVGGMSVNDQRRRKTNMLFVPAAIAMRRDPRFALLTQEIGLDEYWRRTGVTPDHLKAGV